MPEIIYKVALLGPTRSGKTSLISSVLADAQEFLVGTPAKFRAIGSTLKRIQENRQELDGALAAGSFNPGALAGSQDLTTYELSLSVGKSALPIRILDYPGGWLTDNTPEFEEVRDWINECNILILPVDAVVARELIKRLPLGIDLMLQQSKTQFKNGLVKESYKNLLASFFLYQSNASLIFLTMVVGGISLWSSVIGFYWRHTKALLTRFEAKAKVDNFSAFYTCQLTRWVAWI